MKAVKSGAGPLLSDMRVFDLYEGANIGEGRKSVAVTITLTPTKATLTEAEIESISAEIVKIAGKNCGRRSVGDGYLVDNCDNGRIRAILVDRPKVLQTRYSEGFNA